MLFRACLALLVGWLGGSPHVPARQEPGLQDILRRAGAYVEDFQRQLSGIVAEETYVQEIVPPLGMNAGAGRLQRRRLRSDLLLIRPEHAVTWVQFRDVFEVDGKPVRDREERLSRLFLRGDASSANQVDAIRTESARYNLGRIVRTMNVPVLPLAVLAGFSQPRFRFTVGDRVGNTLPLIGSTPVGATPNFRVTAEAWIVNFEEVAGPTLIYTTDRGNIFSRGRFWIEPGTGRVLMSEMITEDDRVRGELLVSYQSEPLLGLLVPVELRERYTESGPRRPTITGQATYSNFRRFEVSVSQSIGPIQ